MPSTDPSSGGKRRKKKKSKKRKRSSASEGVSNEHEERRDAADEDVNEDVSSRKQNKKKKKRRRKENSLDDATNGSSAEAAEKISQPTSTLDAQAPAQDDLPKTKKRKKAKKKKKKQQPSPDDESSSISNKQHNDHNNDNRPASPVLEGSMVDDTMVLVDRAARIVYSATERDGAGTRVAVGTLNKRGEIILTGSNDATISTGKEPKCQDSSDPTEEENCTSDPVFPYEIDPDDHCESPLEAYEDVITLLHAHARRLYKSVSAPSAQQQQQLSIYDPYYCNGRVANHLESLGFPNVYNRKEDCYQVWKDSTRYPKFDILVTNPPYSGDHVEKLMEHVTSKQVANKPWMLLMPNFVHKKDYFQRLTTASGQQPIYVVPHKRYIYQPPANFRDKKASDTHKKSSPFVSMWYLWGGSRQVTDEWYRLLQQQAKKIGNQGGFDVARSKSTLRDLRRKPRAKK